MGYLIWGLATFRAKAPSPGYLGQATLQVIWGLATSPHPWPNDPPGTPGTVSLFLFFLGIS